MIHESMRVKCRKLYRTLHGHLLTPALKENDVDKIEEFSREIRNEALEEAAKITEQRCGTSTIAVKEIRALKEST